MQNALLFAGNANQELATEIAHHLGLTLGQAKVGRFSDGETSIEILQNVRRHHCFIVQSTCSPANDNLMEIMTMADALRRASAESITAIIPYFGYARQDRRVRSARVPITAKIVAEMLTSVGVQRVVTVDLHADQIQGFFYIPVDNVYATPIMLEDMQQQSWQAPLVVSPDVGGVVRARAVAKRLDGVDLAIIDKRRPKPNEARVMHIIGDVKDKDCVIVDDIVDTAGTLSKAVDALKAHGARSVTAYVTHPVLSGKAIENIEASQLDELVVTNTVPLSEQAKQCKRIRQLDLSATLAEAIKRISSTESLSSMFGE